MLERDSRKIESFNQIIFALHKTNLSSMWV